MHPFLLLLCLGFVVPTFRSPDVVGVWPELASGFLPAFVVGWIGVGPESERGSLTGDALRNAEGLGIVMVSIELERAFGALGFSRLGRSHHCERCRR